VRAFGIEDWPEAERRLSAGFGQADADRWTRLGQRLRDVPPGPSGEPLGVLMDAPGGSGGVLLTFSSLRPPDAAGGAPRRVTNLSSWAVDADARGHAMWMITAALRDRGTRYTDLTPAPAVVPVLERMGFELRLPSCIRVWTLAAAARRRRGRVLDDAAAGAALRDHPMVAAFDAHRRLGCRVLALVTGDAPPLAIVLRPRRRRRLLSTAEVLYVDSRDALGPLLPALCAWLVARGVLLLEYEADAAHQPAVPARRLARPRYVRGGLATDDRIDQLHSELIYLDVG
jgi:hypothetical protein